MFSKSFICVTFVVAALSPSIASAQTAEFSFKGGTASGRVFLSYAANPNVGTLPGTAPNPVDPVDSFIITGLNGTFSDSALGITDAVITGLAPLNRVSPEPTNLLAPNSFSLLPVSNGVASPGGVSPGLHFDNLFYPGGSPQTASDYPFAGGVFDIYGIVFCIGGGNFVNLWSNGTVPGAGLNYGVAVTNQVDVTDYVNGVAVSTVPESTTWAMMILGMGTIGFAMRRKQRVQTNVSFT